MGLHNQGLFKRGLFKTGLFARGLWTTLKSFFERLQDLDEPMVVAYEGQDSATTGHWPVPGNVLNLDGVDGHVDVSGLSASGEVVITVYVKPTNFASLRYIFDFRESDGATNFCYVDASGIIQTPSGAGQTLTSGVWNKVDVTLTLTATTVLLLGARFNMAETFLGQMSFFDCVGDTNLQYNLNETSGSLAYDSSGSGDDGTLTGGATRLVDNTLPFDADRANLDGYTVGTGSNGAAAGVIIPADPLTGLDVLGNALDFEGSVYPVQPIREDSYSLSLDGVGAYVRLPSFTGIGNADVFFYEITVKTNSTSDEYLLATRDDTTGGLSLLMTSTGAVRIVRANANQHTSTTTINDGVCHLIRMEYNGDGTGQLIIDGVSEPYTSATSGWTDGNDVLLGARGDGAGGALFFLNGEISRPSINGTMLNLAEGVGDLVFSTTPGITGDIVGGTTGTEGASTWSGRIDGLDTASNLTEGFTKYIDGSSNVLRVPYDTNGDPLSISTPAGFSFVSENPAVLHPAGEFGHNDAETTENAEDISETGTPVPATVNLANFDAIAFADSASTLLATGPVDTAYRRDFSDVTRCRLIIFYDTLTGNDKDLALRYIQGNIWDDSQIWEDTEIWAD